MSLNWNKYTYNINTAFFKTWTPNMAYILGFTCADGCVYRTTLSWDLADKYPSNKELLVSMNEVMGSTYPIEERKNSFRLRISNTAIVDDVKKIGIVPNKKKVLDLPDVPDSVFRHFLRGFVDGDGWVSFRKRKKYQEFSIGFSNGSADFMNSLCERINQRLHIDIRVRTRKKITPNGVVAITHQADLYSKDAYKLLVFLYECLEDTHLALERKRELAKQAIGLYEEIYRRKSVPYRWDGYSWELEATLRELYAYMTPLEISKELGIGYSTTYKWLKRVNVSSDKT